MILITLIMKKAKNILKGLLALAIVFLFTQCTENKNTTPAPAAPAAGGSVEGMKIAYVEIDSLLTKYRFWNDLNELMIQKEENIRTTLNEKAATAGTPDETAAGTATAAGKTQQRTGR